MPKHVLTKEDMARGGKNKTDFSKFISSVSKRKKCNNRCPLYLDCPAMPLSTLENGECKMKTLPKAIQSRFTNMFLDGEIGLIREIKNALFIYTANMDTKDNKERASYIQMLMGLHKTLYGDKNAILNVPEPLQITIKQLEMTGDGKGKGQIIQIGREERARMLYLASHPEKMPVDPESLLNSPNLDAILEGENVGTEDTTPRETDRDPE